MDAKVFRMALLTIISAFILVLVIIYVTNTDKINALIGKKDNSSGVEASSDASSFVTDIIYGQQIGDDLKSFLYEDNFFDENEKILSVVVIQKNTKSSTESTEESVDTSSSQNSEDEDIAGTGMAVVGQLDNPGEGESIIPGDIPPQPGVVAPDQTIEGTPDLAGTPVGNGN